MDTELSIMAVYSEVSGLLRGYNTSLHLSNPEKASKLMERINDLLNQQLLPLRD